MKLTAQQELLYDFVKLAHKDQKRKYTGEDYHVHPFKVAELIDKYVPNCIEVALCHDLYEDTHIQFRELYDFLISISYKPSTACNICVVVDELTDTFTSKKFPYLDRKIRKECEIRRIARTSSKAQSIKCADIIDNTISITENDPDFSVVYLKEIEKTLSILIYANTEIYKKAKQTLHDQQLKLNKTSSGVQKS